MEGPGRAGDSTHDTIDKRTASSCDYCQDKTTIVRFVRVRFPILVIKNPNSKASSVPEQDFRAWSAYNRGEKLYSELSSNIHQYDGSSGEPYDFKLTNWSRSDRLILAALRPDKAYIITNSDGVWDVKWDKERKRQALP